MQAIVLVYKRSWIFATLEVKRKLLRVFVSLCLGVEREGQGGVYIVLKGGASMYMCSNLRVSLHEIKTQGLVTSPCVRDSQFGYLFLVKGV